MAKRRFEDEWKAAFDGAEATPPESVWTGIELDLEKASGAAVRRQLVVYRWLAAASVTLAAGAGSLYFFSLNQPVAPEITNLEPVERITSDDLAKKPTGDFPGRMSNTESLAETQPVMRHNVVEVKKGTTLRSGVNVLVPDREATTREPGLERRQHRTGTSRKMPVLYSFRNPELSFPKTEPVADPGMVLLAKLADEEKAMNKKHDKSRKREQLWTSIGFGAGTFDPNAGTSAGTSSFNATGNSSAGMSYSVGASVGGRMGNRFVLQGGVTYLSQSASYTSSSFSMEATTAVASLDDYIDRQSNLVATSPYEVNSNLQYVSVPVQAGYVLLDRDFAIQLNGGVATDFFIQNTLTPDNDNVAGITQKAGEASPYRSVNFSGIVGTELSYRFGAHYRIAVNPGIRYAFNSIYKPDISREITPVTYDIALRFRYIFN
jgi:hypothetical protein